MRGFWLIAIAFAIAMLGTTLPTPLYPIYERAYGFGALMVTIVFAAYAFGVLAGLLFFGHMSDEVGRRPILVSGLVLSALSALAFFFAHDMAAIFAGRILSGLSAGIFTGSATAALVDLVLPERRGRAAAIAVAANIGGLGLGTLLSGVLGQYAPYPLQFSYAVDFALACVAIFCVLMAPETVTSRQALRVRVQRLRIPAEIRGVFLQAAILGMCGFAVAGLFSAIAPSLLASLLKEPNHALAGLLVFALMGMTAIGQIVVRRFSRGGALFASCALLLLGMVMLAASLEWRMTALLFGSAIVEGLGMGLGIGSGLAEINERIHERRGEVSSAYFVLLYIGLAFPVIGVGLLATHVGLRNAGLIFAAIIAAVLLAVMAVSAIGSRLRSDAP